jgi:hypothetical protein
MSAERAIRWSTIAAVTAVAAVAGWVSYEHALAVVRAHGETGAVARVYPAAVDGLIYSASMVLLDAARRDAEAPRLARWLLAAGIAATLAANVTAGLRSGLVGAVVAAWPALALVGSYELLMWLVRHGVNVTPGTPDTVSSPVPSDAENAALASLRATLAAGNPWSQNQLAERFGLTRAQATKVRSQVLAGMNGQHPLDGGEPSPDN